tara:strand:- start:46 stop:222 length:177 start_codon:yes stop_codon:yes gene_type:complete
MLRLKRKQEMLRRPSGKENTNGFLLTAGTAESSGYRRYARKMVPWLRTMMDEVAMAGT